MASELSLPPGEPGRTFIIAMLLLWVFVFGIYMAIASWALFSNKGRTYLQAQEKIPTKGNRGILWFIKFLVACLAAAFSTQMVLSVLALPFVGTSGFDEILGPNGNLYLSIAGVAWAPLIFRYLK